MELNGKGIFVSKNRVARHMQEMNLQARTHKRKRNTYRKVESSLISQNLLNRVFTRKVVGWHIDTNMSEDLVITAIKIAIQNENPPGGLIVHILMIML